MAEETQPLAVRKTGLLAGPMLAALVLLAPLPAELTSTGRAAAAVSLLMGIWWMTEALPLAATALVPLVLFPLLGIAGLDQTARAYANPLIFLFLGGFIIARALERWGLHHRLAGALAFRGGGINGRIAGLMATTAFLSMWVSNTATAMVMLPVGLALVETMRRDAEGLSTSERKDPGAVVMLAIAYSATIGGMASLIGTPPNALFAAYMQSTHGIRIGFAQWMAVGVPIALLLLALTYVVLTRFAFQLPKGLAAAAEPLPRSAAEPWSRGQKATALILATAVALWVGNPLLLSLFPRLPLTDAGVAIAAALALFIVPASWREGRPLLTWREASDIPWAVLILVGGGLALAEGISASGLAHWIGSTVAGLKGLPLALTILIIVAVIVLLGELASNTAVAAIFLPVAGAVAAGLGQAPLTLALPVVLATSLGFMLPVATPPNAIVYGSGHVTSGQMLRAGAVLDIGGAALVAAFCLLIGGRLLGG